MARIGLQRPCPRVHGVVGAGHLEVVVAGVDPGGDLEAGGEAAGGTGAETPFPELDGVVLRVAVVVVIGSAEDEVDGSAVAAQRLDCAGGDVQRGSRDGGADGAGHVFDGGTGQCRRITVLSVSSIVSGGPGRSTTINGVGDEELDAVEEWDRGRSAVVVGEGGEDAGAELPFVGFEVADAGATDGAEVAG